MKKVEDNGKGAWSWIAFSVRPSHTGRMAASSAVRELIASYVIGDIHGQLDALVRLLREVGLIGKGLFWTGRDATLSFVGDFFDRGPDGIGVLELVMRLQQEAAAAGGRVDGLLGNHEPLLLAAHHFPDAPTTGPGGTFRADWELNGGVPGDLARLNGEHITWLSALPAMLHVGDRLLMHADALFYRSYGSTVPEVNRSTTLLLQGQDLAAWDRLLDQFSERDAFLTPDGAGESRARECLRVFGGRQLIHGHTPISRTTGRTPQEVTAPLVYAGDLCVNVDGGLYLGGTGFVYRLPPAS